MLGNRAVRLRHCHAVHSTGVSPPAGTRSRAVYQLALPASHHLQPHHSGGQPRGLDGHHRRLWGCAGDARRRAQHQLVHWSAHRRAHGIAPHSRPIPSPQRALLPDGGRRHGPRMVQLRPRDRRWLYSHLQQRGGDGTGGACLVDGSKQLACTLGCVRWASGQRRDLHVVRRRGDRMCSDGPRGVRFDARHHRVRLHVVSGLIVLPLPAPTRGCHRLQRRSWQRRHLHERRSQRASADRH